MSLPETDKITAAVVTGGHGFDVPRFHALFRSLAGVDCYIQPMEDFVSDVGKVREDYDVVVFYNMHRGMPADQKGLGGRAKPVLEKLGTTEQGILVLHHATLAYLDWPFWSDLVGIQDRTLTSYHHGEKIHVEIANAGHPITQGLEPWEMVDETYVMNEPDADNEVLLTVDHPRSMKAIGWTRTFGKSRVFCLESGHDDETYVDPSFRKVLLRGIQWCAKKI